MSQMITIEFDETDMARVVVYFDAVAHRLEGESAKQELTPILLEALQPLIESEKGFLSGHNKSGALAGSLIGRAGRGDYPGTVSVYSAPTAKASTLKVAWAGGRKQQRGWAAKLKPKGLRSVFYGAIVHQGHRIVKRNAAGELYATGGVVDPIPFARQAVESKGDQQMEAAAEAVLDKIVNG